MKVLLVDQIKETLDDPLDISKLSAGQLESIREFQEHISSRMISRLGVPQKLLVGSTSPFMSQYITRNK